MHLVSNSGGRPAVKKLVFIPQARADILDAFEWYEHQSQGLGLEFMRCLDALFHAIERRPHAYPCVLGEYHRALLSRFPYAVFYEIHDEIMVYAVFHCAQNPMKWQKRK